MNIKDYKDIYGRNKNQPAKKRVVKAVNVRHKPNRMRNLLGNKRVRVAKSTNKW